MKRSVLYLALVTLLLSRSAFGAQYDIYFGGENGSPAFGYSPQSLNVSIGDTITWHGDFTMHPLASFVTPDGVASFQNSSGNSFSYVITTNGSYRYRCLAHSTPDGQGMAGVFIVGTAGVPNGPSDASSLSPSYPNPIESGSASSMIHIVLEKRSHVKLDLFDAKGNRVRTLIDADEDAGMHMITVDATELPNGTYSYVLSTPEAVLRRGLVIAR